MKKTNAIRIVESHQIDFDVLEYKFNEVEIDAVSVAEKIGAAPETVFKTLAANGNDNNHYVFVIPGNYELNLKKAAASANVKKIELIKVKDLLGITGYIRGGCSPIGMKKLFPTFIDESAQLFERIYVSAGIRGAQLHLSPKDLSQLIFAVYSDLI